MTEYKKKRVNWIIENHGETIKEILKLVAEFKARGYYIPEEHELDREFEMSDEEYALQQKHNALIDKIKEAFIDEFYSSENVALKHIFLAIRQTRRKRTT